MNARPTTEEALTVIRLITGAAPAIDQPTRCPRCGGDALVVNPNGGGAHYAGCSCQADELDAYVLDRLHAQRLAAIRDMLNDWGRPKNSMPAIRRIVKQGRAGEAYDLELEDGRTIELGSAADLLNRAKFRAALLGQVDIVVVLKPDDHANLASAIACAAELRELPTAVEQAAGWIATYVPEAARRIDVANTPALWDQLTVPDPFLDVAGRVHLRLEHFTTWINRSGSDRVTTRDVALRLGRLGFESERLAVREGKKIRRGRYWIAPADFEAGG